MSRFAQLGLTPNRFPDPYKTPQYSGDLVIVGSGRRVWEDLMNLPLRTEYDVMCINDVIMHYPHEMTHIYSNDNRMLPKWLAARRPRYVMDQVNPIMHSCNEIEGGVQWPFPGHGTSGLGAVYVGLALGYENIVLCGVPMDGSGHYYDPPGDNTNYMLSLRYWKNAIPIFSGQVTSMSGHTRDLLGSPNNNSSRAALR